MAAGQKDTLALNSILNGEEIFAICLNSETQSLSKELYEELNSRAEKLYVLYDNDLTGILSSFEMQIRFPEIEALEIPMEVNDVGDLIERRAALREYSGTTEAAEKRKEEFEEKRDKRRDYFYGQISERGNSDTSKDTDLLFLDWLLKRLVSFFSVSVPVPSSSVVDHLAHQSWMSAADGVKAICSFFSSWLDEKDADRINRKIEKEVIRRLESEDLTKEVFEIKFGHQKAKSPESSKTTQPDTSHLAPETSFFFLDTIEVSARRRPKSAHAAPIRISVNGQPTLFPISMLPKTTQGPSSKIPGDHPSGILRDHPYKPSAHDWLKHRRKQNKIEVKNLNRVIAQTKCP